MILAIGQENAFPWIERDIGIEFDKWDMPVVDKTTFMSTRAGRVLRRRRRVGPGEHHLGGRARAPGRHLDPPTTARACRSPSGRAPGMNLSAPRWACTSGRTATTTTRRSAPEDEARRAAARFSKMSDRSRRRASPPSRRAREVERCLNCDVQTHFTDALCIECDACIDICPVDCLTIARERRGAG